MLESKNAEQRGRDYHPALRNEQKAPAVHKIRQCARGKITRNTGRVVAAVTRLTIRGDMVSWVMSQPAPTFCIQVPV